MCMSAGVGAARKLAAKTSQPGAAPLTPRPFEGNGLMSGLLAKLQLKRPTR